MPTLRILQRLVKAQQPAPTQRITYQPATVTAVTAGGSTDGRAQVSVSVNGIDSFPATYLRDTYPTPAVNDVVGVLFVNGSPLILGRPGGFPTF